MADVTAFLETGEDVWRGRNGSGVKRVRCDFSKTGALAADVVKIFTALAGTMVHGVYSKVITAEGATATGNLGDGASASGYNDAVDLNGTAGDWEAPDSSLNEAAPNTLTDALALGKFYAADDTIDLVPDHDLDTAVMDFFIHYTNLNNV